MSIGIPDTALDLGRFFFGWCWFWALRIVFLQILLCKIFRCWEAKNSRSLYSNNNTFLRVDCLKAIFFLFCFLFNEQESEPQGLTIIRCFIVWNWESKWSTDVCCSCIFVSSSWLWDSKSKSMSSPFDRIRGVSVNSVMLSGVRFLGTEELWVWAEPTC